MTFERRLAYAVLCAACLTIVGNTLVLMGG